MIKTNDFVEYGGKQYIVCERSLSLYGPTVYRLARYENGSLIEIDCYNFPFQDKISLLSRNENE